MNNNLDSSDIFNKWTHLLRTEYHDSRYLHSERPELIEILVGLFKKYNFGKDEVEGYERDVILQLTHEEGRKGKGQYKGWVDSVKQDFKGVVANSYLNLDHSTIDTFKKQKDEAKKNEINEDDYRYFPPNELITQWAKDKFKSFYSEAIKKECHRIGSSLNIMFQEKTFEKDLDL